MMDNSSGSRLPTIPKVKGKSDYLIIDLAGADVSSAAGSLSALINGNPSFYKGAKVVINLGDVGFRVNDLCDMRDILSENQISLQSLHTESELTERSARLLGMKVNPIVEERKVQPETPIEVAIPGEEALLIQKTLRSGVEIDTDRHVIVVGDINPGAKVSTKGVIIVWGKVRGIVKAGKDGNRNVYICALDLEPNLLEIADLRLPIKPRRGKSVPEIAYIDNGQVKIGAW